MYLKLLKLSSSVDEEKAFSTLFLASWFKIFVTETFWYQTSCLKLELYFLYFPFEVTSTSIWKQWAK